MNKTVVFCMFWLVILSFLALLEGDVVGSMLNGLSGAAVAFILISYYTEVKDA